MNSYVSFQYLIILYEFHILRPTSLKKSFLARLYLLMIYPTPLYDNTFMRRIDE